MIGLPGEIEYNEDLKLACLLASGFIVRLPV